MSKSSLRTGVHEVEGREGVPIRAKRERARNLHPGSATIAFTILTFEKTILETCDI